LRILTPPPERRIHPAGRRTALGLPDESGVPIGMAARLGDGDSILIPHCSLELSYSAIANSPGFCVTLASGFLRKLAA
jgi:hypothetical protein